MPDVDRRTSSLRFAAAWLISLTLVGVYLSLPDNDDDGDAYPPALQAESGEDPRKLEIVRIRPTDPSPGAAIAIAYAGTPRSPDVIAFAGREPLEVLARRPGSLVAQLPSRTTVGHVKIRVSTEGERSKPYDVTVKARDLRKPFRALVGGLALLLIGTAALSRGARAAVGLDTASRLARLVKRRAAAIGFGTVVGALTQSTTAAAGVLSALVGSSVLAVGPAAMAFLGAAFATSVAPFVVTGLIEPRDGPLAIAVGALFYALAPDRRAAAIGRLLLGAGFLSFGLYILRPGFEPFLSDPTLLSAFRHLRASDVGGVARCALLGAVLVAVFQGPAPVVVLVLALAEATGLWDLQTALAVLSGSSLGAALAALVTMQPGKQSRELGTVNVAAGALGTVFSASTVHFWAHLSDAVVRGAPHEMHWGKRVLLPNLGWHLVLAFALSQLTATVLLSLVIPRLERLASRFWARSRHATHPSSSDPVKTLRESLLRVLSIEDAALGPIEALSLGGDRSAGRRAEHHLTGAREILEVSLAEVVPTLRQTGPGSELGRVAFTCLQLHRSIEAVLAEAERLTDARLTTREDAEARPLFPEDEGYVRQIQSLLRAGVTDAAASLESGTMADLDSFREREILMNGIEARARGALVSPQGDADAMRSRLGVLELIDACEVAGNHVYRLAQTLGDADALDRSTDGALVSSPTPADPPTPWHS